MIKAQPEIVPFKVGDTVALIKDLSDTYTVADVRSDAFGHLLKLVDSKGNDVWDWSTYYITVGVPK
jgi:hypothetical protein